MPEPMIHKSALKLRYCGKGLPVKQISVMVKKTNAKNMVIRFNDIGPIRLLETSAEREEPVQTKEAQRANSSPRSIIEF